VCFALSLVTQSVTAQAVSAQTETPEYQALIDRAVTEYEAHNFAEARALFTDAHAVNPNARTLRGLGMVAFELKDYPESITRLDAALASRVKPLDGDLRKQTEELLARANAFVARYELDIKPALASSRIIVDGVPLEIATGQALTLAVGEHVLEVQAPGYQEEKRALNVTGGEAQRIVIELQPIQAAPALATSAQPARREQSVWNSPWLWTGVGAVVAGGVVAAVLLSSGGTKPIAPISGDIGGIVQTLVVK
jgi:tetratricopeptide (TPR) repeat protein